MLERMGEFFDNRIDGYEEHQLNCIDGAKEFYPFTAKNLPTHDGCHVLDLGCGTGLELEYYFKYAPKAKVMGIDLAEGMLSVLKEKFSDKDVELIAGSYFDVPFGVGKFDAAVSVESLHHFTKEEKIPLYSKLCKALKCGGYFILTDYFSMSDEEEEMHRNELERLKAEYNISDNGFYHYDTPLTVEHERQALISGGFSKTEILKSWGATYTIKAYV